MAKGIDRAVPFTKMKSLELLKKYNYTFIGRYLSQSAWKALTPKEAKLISDAGLYIVSVYQDSNNKDSYFTTQRGKADAYRAVQYASKLVQPTGTPIYFAVDYDAGASSRSLARVYAYFAAVIPIVESWGYDVGVYGSHDVCKLVRNKFGLKYAWQTKAWSKGKRYINASLYQSEVDIPLPENASFGNVDINESNGAGGGWKVKE